MDPPADRREEAESSASVKLEHRPGTSLPSLDVAGVSVHVAGAAFHRPELLDTAIRSLPAAA